MFKYGQKATKRSVANFKFGIFFANDTTFRILIMYSDYIKMMVYLMFVYFLEKRGSYN